MNLLAVGGLALSLLGSPLYSEPAPSEQMKIEVINVNGSGCTAGTTAVAMSPDNTAFTVTYSDYLAQVGVGATAKDNRKFCQLTVGVKVPSGFTFAIVKADYRGYAQLQKGAYAVSQANYYFQGMSETVRVPHRFQGAFDDNWFVSDETAIESLSWYPCGELRNLNIGTELRVYPGTSDVKTTTSYMTVDSVDGSISTKYHFAWRKCVQ